MGSGRWDPGTYRGRTENKLRNHGTAFVYSSTAMAAGTYEVHETLDPKVTAGPTSPFVGSVMREARDNDEHPETLPIVVMFDVTGSMQHLPGVLQTKLPKLYSLLLAKGYVEHPQIMFGAIGDATCDRVPLQVGQFESDNRADENLENLFLEGGGGGGNHESYELAAYFIARHTATDAWDKRGKRGYCFIIGDERVYNRVDRAQVERLIGDKLQDDITTPDIFAELRERWDTYYLFAEQGTYDVAATIDGTATDPGAYGGGVLGWRDVLGQQALVLEDAAAVCETIALTIGLGEGIIDLDRGIDDLTSVGTDTKAIESATKALATVGAGVSTSGGSSDEDLDVSGEEGAERL